MKKIAGWKTQIVKALVFGTLIGFVGGLLDLAVYSSNPLQSMTPTPLTPVRVPVASIRGKARQTIAAGMLTEGRQRGINELTEFGLSVISELEKSQGPALDQSQTSEQVYQVIFASELEHFVDQLTEEGQLRRSAILLAYAAKLLKDSNQEYFELLAKTGSKAHPEQASTPKVTEKRESEIEQKTKSLLDTALQLAAKNQKSKNYVMAIKRLGKKRGPVDGTKRFRSRIESFAEDRFAPIHFKSQEDTIFMLSGDGDSQLNLSIFDTAGNLIGETQNQEIDDCVFVWKPPQQIQAVIVIKNLGRVSNRYTLVASSSQTEDEPSK